MSRHSGVLLLVAGAACRHVSGSECDPVDTSEGCNMVATDTGGWDCLCGMGCARWAPAASTQEASTRILLCCRLFDFKSKHQCQAALLLKGCYLSIELKLIQKVIYSFQRVHMRTLVRATPATTVR